MRAFATFWSHAYNLRTQHFNFWSFFYLAFTLFFARQFNVINKKLGYHRDCIVMKNCAILVNFIKLRYLWVCWIEIISNVWIKIMFILSQTRSSKKITTNGERTIIIFWSVFHCRNFSKISGKTYYIVFL